MLLATLSGVWQKHFASQSPDYVAADSLVNQVRREINGPAVASVAAGTAIGATVGFVRGVQNQAHDQVTVQTQHFEAMKPVLVGAHYVPEDSTWHPTYDDKGNLSGGYYTYDGDYFRSIQQSQHTGLTWDKKALVHSMSYGPIKGALVGGAIGAGTGLVVGVGAALVDHMLHGDADPWGTPRVPQTPWQRKLARAADHAPLAGTVVGTLAGAALGLGAARVAAAHDVVLNQTWQEPVMENRVIGWIPNAATRHDIPATVWDGHDVYYDKLAPGQFGNPPFQGQRAVTESVPTGAYQTMTATEHANSLSPLGGILFGSALGALSGVAAGVALGVAAKAMAGEDPPRGY